VTQSHRHTCICQQICHLDCSCFSQRSKGAKCICPGQACSQGSNPTSEATEATLLLISPVSHLDLRRMCESESEWFHGGGFVLVRLEKWSCPQGSAKSLPDTEASQQHVANAIRLHIFHRVSSRADRVKLAQGLCQNWGHGFSLWRHWFCRELSYTGRQIQQLCISPNPPNKHFRISNAFDDICLYSIMSEQPHILGSRQYRQEVHAASGETFWTTLSICAVYLHSPTETEQDFSL